ncbi:hypothetical protein CEXT_426361 [Caerostris extrusa]|uniref:Uncharacterized protein n=1 Tax=Caerostris extrusa TaxID=172846 RepID=A0AAV4SVA2_CAEEX|nr:hypothetical protein CEXT_426361 [Caerostris extrusa]
MLSSSHSNSPVVSSPSRRVTFPFDSSMDNWQRFIRNSVGFWPNGNASLVIRRNDIRQNDGTFGVLERISEILISGKSVCFPARLEGLTNTQIKG